MRIARPFLITAVIVPFVMPGFDLQGRGLLLEIVVGALLGLAAHVLGLRDADRAARQSLPALEAPRPSRRQRGMGAFFH
ncbi:hypothetical protein [Microtetraspora malaysiensis]|uniref:Uncharacterized protein n=1 Tax=Microtetraspora malaysiensis TaxID=161358 RepID=A0ABW6T0T0_9ACTN